MSLSSSVVMAEDWTYHMHQGDTLSELSERFLKPEFTPEMLTEMEKLLPPKLNRIVATSLASCIHCGMCTDACHYSVSIPEDKKLVPAYKADRFRKWYKSRFDWMAKVFPQCRGLTKLERVATPEGR